MAEVKLISYTQGVGDLDIYTLSEQIAYTARVSNPSNQLAQDRDDERLINYLIRNKHWSPFEMVNICLEIKTSRAIVRQILRHRSFSFQEFSQRYAAVDEREDMIESEARLKDTKNRQNSFETDDTKLKNWWRGAQRDHYRNTMRLYNTAIDQGMASEVARVVLPEGMTPSTIYMNGSVRSWIHYIQLRSGNGTQKEHREVAILCTDAIFPIFPQIKNIMEKNDG